MRLKNVKGAKARIECSPYIINNYLEMKGHFRKLFGNDNPIHLEIGTGKGAFLIEMARLNPNLNFIGIERYDSVLVRAIEKVDFENLTNIFFIREDAFLIDTIFDHEIDKIYLNFSDPWPKERHAKRRLTSPIFLKKYEQIFKGKRIIQMKTDNQGLFTYSLITLTNNNYQIRDLSLDLYHSNILNNVPTEYEIKFHELGKPIYYGFFEG